MYLRGSMEILELDTRDTRGVTNEKKTMQKYCTIIRGIAIHYFHKELTNCGRLIFILFL